MPDKSSKQGTWRGRFKLSTAKGLVPSGASNAPTERRESKKNGNPGALSPQSLPGTPHDSKPGTSGAVGAEDMKGDVQDTLGDAIHEETPSSCVEKQILVNKHGRLSIEDLLVRIDALQEQQAEYLTTIATHSKALDSLEFLAGFIEDRITTMAALSSPYKHQRNRFISIFKRDKLGIATETDLRIIGARDDLVEGGDAVVDAILYTGLGGRRDYTAFQRLYGFQPETVLRIEHPQTITVLNLHAGVLSSKWTTGSEKFYHLFAEFVRTFAEVGDGFEEGFLKGRATETTHAYWAFLGCVDSEVSKVAVRS
ncbi:unnamed protein product [Tuber aestivum]|uniref:Uncharacterized protein n=1 Tax=Tuber aestivum TaxID=59557 RepID=A0A292PMV8_9PEZI|nr:unnamed protein product [Tuber aestivum]